MEKQVEISPSMPLLELTYEEDGVVRHPFPLNCLLRHWYIGSDFYHAVKIGIVQYVCINRHLLLRFLSFILLCLKQHFLFIQMILKTICALLAIILELFGVYGEGKFEWTYG